METASEVVGGPELSQQKPSILQESQAQAAILEALRARHTKELEALSSCQAIQLAELRTCQAAEDEAAQAQMLQLHQESADHLATQQLHVEAERNNLAAEIQSMQTHGLTGRDFLELNVGGKVISTTRETLMQVPGSMLALMFGPRHAASLNRDSHGHIFLDFDPDSFVQILSYLRSIEHPDRPAPAPVVQPGSQSTFTNLVYYLGLEDFVGLIRFDKASAISMNISKDGHAAKGCITKHVDSQCFAAPAMQRGAVYYLRCTISHFTPSSQMYMGIAQPSESTATSRKYTTSSGWNSTHTIRRGYENDSPPPGWCSGDELVFKFDLADDKGLLSVWSNKSQQLHHIKLSCDCDAEKPYFFHFATTQHNAIRLEPTSEQDQQVFT